MFQHQDQFPGRAYASGHRIVREVEVVVASDSDVPVTSDFRGTEAPEPQHKGHGRPPYEGCVHQTTSLTTVTVFWCCWLTPSSFLCIK